MMVTVVATGFRRQVQEVPQVEVVESAKQQTQTKLKFVDQGAEGKVFQPSGFSLDHAVTIAMKKAPHAMGITESGTAPKGVGQLKKFDRPAFERRGFMPEITANPIGSGNGNGNGNGNGHTDIHEEFVNAAMDELPIKIANERPAFLRKIMD